MIKYRLTIRWSFQNDYASKVRNPLVNRMETLGVVALGKGRRGKNTGVLEGRGMTMPAVSRAIAEFSESVSLPVAGNSSFAVDHIWIYVEEDPFT